MTTNSKKLPWSIPELLVKSGVAGITIGIGLWCGFHDSYNAFYVAALVQSVNNAYDSMNLISGYNRFIAFFHITSFILAIITFIISVIHFCNGDVNSIKFVIFVIFALSIPVAHYLLEILLKFVAGDY